MNIRERAICTCIHVAVSATRELATCSVTTSRCMQNISVILFEWIQVKISANQTLDVLLQKQCGKITRLNDVN